MSIDFNIKFEVRLINWTCNNQNFENSFGGHSFGTKCGHYTCTLNTLKKLKIAFSLWFIVNTLLRYFCNTISDR